MTATDLDTSADAPLISLADFHVLLADQHPFSLLLGIDVLRIGRGTARAVLPARDAHQRLGGIVAGPMLMGLADLTMYAAVVGATGQAHAVTASLTINFLRKSPAGAIYADARLLKVGRLSAGEVILTGEGSDEPLAHIVSTWSVPKP
ncbi:PaaI family thioesterase [Achromobacter anxifer]|uniref:PaaI family thioesterase n=1 Tax=Achromobacter anxifer TaxID=1287737 RepID=UPI0021577633|nr:PaaI family thioesterase [Achromobacter anxifer]